MVLTVCLSVSAVILIIILYVNRRRRTSQTFKAYRGVATTTVKSPPAFSTTSHALQPRGVRHLRPTPGGIRAAFSSEESVSPFSSEHEDNFYDARDKFGSRSTMSSREPSPSSQYEDEEDDELEDYGEDHLGRVWFSVEYDKGGESLSVCVVKARNLSTLGRAVKTFDPFVKVQILPKRRRISCDQQTTHKRKTNRPNFNETFCFHMSLADLKCSSLQLTVCDGYRASQLSTIGQASFPLFELDTESKIDAWRDLEEPIEVNVKLLFCYFVVKTRLIQVFSRSRFWLSYFVLFSNYWYWNLFRCPLN